jgi:hypothetical protein
MPRHGILLEDVSYARLCELVMGVTREARYDYLYTRNNVVACNEIHRVDADSQDAGAIEAWNTGRGNVCRGNVIHDVGNRLFSLQAGICLDDGTDSFMVSNNIIRDVEGVNSYCIRVDGVSNAVRNNILVASPDTHAMFRSSAWNDDTAGLDYSRNILCMPQSNATIHLFMRWDSDMIAACDSNLYWKPRGGELLFEGKVPARNWSGWRALRGGRYDAHSVIADPMFADVANGDFKLKPGSPALKLGFVQIDARAAGLTADFPKRFPRK